MASDGPSAPNAHGPSSLRGAAAAIGFAATGAALLAAAWTGFHVERNDFWALVELSNEETLRSPADLYNGFYPFGYLLFLRALDATGLNLVVAATCVSVAALGLLARRTWKLALWLMPTPWAVVALVLVTIAPGLVRYATLPGPDMLAVALAITGFAAAWHSGSPAAQGRARGAALTAGLSFGLAALLRYHLLVFAGAAFAALALERRTVRPFLLAAGFTAALYSAQVALNLTTGHGPLETAQWFNVHKLMHDVNWFQTASVPAPGSALEPILESPGVFASAYLEALRPGLVLLIAPALLALLAAGNRARSFGRGMFVTSALYLGIVSAGGSSRGSLPIIPLTAIAAAAVGHEVVRRLGSAFTRSGRARVLLGSGVVVFGLLWALNVARADWGIFKQRRRAQAIYARVDADLRRGGVLEARQVFSSDLNLYLPVTHGHVPSRNGTWLRVGDTAYARRFPDLCVESLECFLRDARGRGITHVVLGPEAWTLSPALGGLYASEWPHGLVVVRAADGLKTFRVP